MAFKVILPETEDELMMALMEDNVKIMAGGTDLMVKIRADREKPEKVVLLSKLKGMDEIEDLGDRIRIGCKVTHTQILESELLQKDAKILTMAVREIGSPQIRNKGTLVGNVVNASPAGDSILALYLSNAKVVIRGPKGERSQDIEDFIVGPGKTTLSLGEYVRAIVFEKTGEWFPFFYKVGQRNAMAISVTSVGALVEESKIRIAFGSVAPTVVRAHKAERYFEREGIDGTKLEQFVDYCMEYVTPISDIRASAWYRKEVTKNLITKIIELWNERRGRCAPQC
ncbi:xanthine dehydrogenase family protein subunit M [Kosmotoga sp.]|uniref:FAD binding domain-containing protein n=1 Tax=Kosmotoga sp. TaxID=1955248 RepID=UPI0024AA64AD|nr:xanthine dehydrogenase family protein subunit M [Kosmotoga sp.]MDI3524247.1 hypothetical protein [Kosmotoga sp.]